MTNQFDLIASKVADFTAIYAKFAQQYHLNLNELRILYFIFQKKKLTQKIFHFTGAFHLKQLRLFAISLLKKGILRLNWTRLMVVKN